MFEEPFFIRRKMNSAKLPEYGFTKGINGYQYTTSIMDGQLTLLVSITPEGFVSTQVLDPSSGEEYWLYRVPSSAGAYAGEVRTACGKVLADISQKCYEPDIFHQEQTLAVINYVRDTFGDELEFLWDKFPNNAIWRRKDNQKWYGLIITISERKLGLNSDKIVEAIDLRLNPEQMADTIDHRKFFPGWHMNKKSWYTVILNASLPLEEICQRIEESYNLAIK